jgi:hypothetical protein
MALHIYRRRSRNSQGSAALDRLTFPKEKAARHIGLLLRQTRWVVAHHPGHRTGCGLYETGQSQWMFLLS